MFNFRIITLVVTLAISAAALAVAPLASAKGGDPVRVRGVCTQSSTAKLKLSNENGRIEVEFEVDQNRNSRLWNVRLSDDGHRVFTGARRTVAPSGSFTLRVLIPNRSGVDTITARAVNATTGEVCLAKLNV